MKPGFYDKSKRATVYGSIFIYKIISLILLIALTVSLAVIFFKERAMYEVVSGGKSSPLIIVGAICIIFFISNIVDFYILFSTVSIGKRLNKLAYIDHLTGLPNRYSCDLLIESFSSPDRLAGAGFMLMQISNLNSVNDTDGHTGGNWLISEFSEMLEDVSENYGYIGRNGGNEFIILIENCDSTTADMFLLDLTKRIHGYNEMNVGSMVEVVYSRVLNCDEHLEKISDLVSLGYKKIHEMPQRLS